MRPTLHQIYCNPLLIIEALNEAGVENAQAKVMAMMQKLAEHFSMKRYFDRLEKDRTYTHQSEERRLRFPNAKPDPENVRRNYKSIAEYNRTIIVARGYLKRTARQMERKVDKWPDLNLDPKALRQKPDHELVNKVLKKRMKRGKKRVQVLG
jgi:hypothetical protein